MEVLEDGAYAFNYVNINTMIEHLKRDTVLFGDDQMPVYKLQEVKHEYLAYKQYTN